MLNTLSKHIAGWKKDPGYGGTLINPDYQSLEGPWINGKPPEDA